MALRKLSASKIQAITSKKVTDRIRFHELERFTKMTVKQLLARLPKIKSPVKCEAMRQMAKDNGLRKVAKAARTRRNELVNTQDYLKKLKAA